MIFIIRTRLNPLKSRPHPALALTAAAVLGFAFVCPFTPLGAYFGFVPLPAAFYGTVILLTLAYLVLVNVVKSGFYARRLQGLQRKSLQATITENKLKA